MTAKYDKIGIDYNLTRKADPYLVSRLDYHLQTNKVGYYLDIGCGTGNYTIKLSERGRQFIGIDPSIEMLEKAKSRKQDVDWRLGSVEKLPLGDEHVIGIVASLTIHHWKALDTGFQELYRVLKPDGRLVVFTATPKQMEGYWLNHYFPNMLRASTQQMPAYAKVEQAMHSAGFNSIKTEPYFIQEGLEDLFLYAGKHQPKRYFDPQIRKGISSFSALANAVEVAEGLEKLAADIESGHIDWVIKSYENKEGDYLYIVAKK